MKHRITKLGVMMVMILLSSSFIFAQMQLNGPGAKMPPGNQDLYRILYEQIELDANGWASQDFEAAYDIYDCQGADDFIVPAEATWVIETVTAYGSGSPGPFSSANVLFYNDVGGAPSASPFASYMGVSATDVDGVMTINLPSGGLTIDGGHYWISVQDAAPFGAYGQWFWTRNINVYNSLAHWRNPLDGFGSGATSWTPVDVAFGETADFAFTLEGESYVEVGTGTSYGGYPSYYGPWGNYWRNQHTQQLYLASELGGPKDITEIAYNFERIAYPDNWLINVHITIKETSISSFTSGAYFDMTGGTEVYYSSYMIPATTTGWRVFDIDDFTYSGTQNLVIDILDGDNGYYEYPYYRTYKSYGSGYRTLIGYADYETPPNYDGASYYYDNMRFYYKPALDPGDIEGYVFNGDGLTIAGATIGIEDIGSTTSGSDGYYLLEDIPTGDQEVSATKAGYNVTTHTVTVPSGGIAYQDFVLTQPTMFISPTIHDYTLNPNEYFTTQTGILNTGDGELGWTAVIEYPTTDASGYVPKYGQGSDPVIKYGNVSDANAVTRTGAGDEIVQDGTRDVGDVLAQWPSPLGMAWGMGFDGNNLWITDPTYLPTTISEVTLDGDLTGNTISCAFGGSWFGDMASDGTYLYGVNVGGDNAIKVIELATGDLVESITGDFSSTSQRGLAYDEANDEFYVGGWNSDMIWRTDHSGATISSTSFNGVSGLAWHPQGGPDAEGSLWVVENSPGDLVTELDPNNGWAVLQSFLLPDGGGYGGAGLALDNSGNLWMPNQNTNIVYNVDTDEPLSGGGIGDWLTLDWYEGTVPAGGGLENVPTNFDASGASAGETYTAAIIFSSSPDVGTITIPCTMTILGTALVPPTNLEATLINDITGRVDLTWEWGTRAFEYFVVKRNGTTVGSTTNTYYTDYPPAFGEYCYTVVAQYDEGQTAPAGPECIMWADPEIYVDPMSLEAWVWPDHQVTVQTTIYNTGIGTLTYEFPEWTTDDFSCNYQVAMYDDFGDGWNGGELTIYVNGTPVLTDITLSSGAGPAYESFLVYDGDEITSTFVCGSFCYECSYEILDCDGEVVYTDGGGGVNPSGIPAGALYAAVPHPGFIVDVDPASGIIEEGGDETITIKYDATGYPVGDWTEDLLLESNDPDNSELTIDNTMHVYAPGLFAGNVTDGNTGLGINGVTVTAGMWQATTDPDGDYMLYVDEGTYDVYFEKLGYQEVMIADTFAQEAVTTPIDVEMFEEPYAPGWVYADPNQDDTECLVTWSLPMGPYEILYDDGSDEELVVWATAGNENAVKFTPLGYPATVVGGRLYVGDGSFPDGTWLNTEVAVLVYDDDGTGGMPGTMVDSIAALIDNFGWVDFWGLSSTFDDGDFYISMRQLNPAPNSPPLGVDYDPPTVYRSYSKLATAAEWTLSVYQDFMIRAYVEGPVTDSEIADGNTVMSPAKLPPGIEGKFFFSKNGTRFNGVPGYEKGGDIRPVTEGEGLNANRDVVDYEIARLSDFDPVAGPETGTATILADGLPGLSYNDVAFGGLDMGWYAYAVRAYYTNGDVSDWTYSNVVGHLKDVEITFIVTLSTGALPENVEISMDGDDYPFNKYFAVTDTTGIHVFDSVIKGSYDISAFKIGFETYLIPNYMAVDDDVIEIQLCEKRYPARNLYVDPLTSIATWDWPLVSAVFEDFEDETFPPEGWQALTEGMGWFRSDDGSG
ncbi:MAG: carboxypeptidase-like regulatory domain-containing protein, partial [Bacteroidales bacterium]